MDETVIIRPYQSSNLKDVITLLQLNTPKYFAPEEEKDLHHYLQYEKEQYYVLTAGDEVAGCGGINFSADGATAKISWDIFHPQHQGKGYGTLLLQYRIQQIKSNPQVQTISVRTSQLVYLFYQRNGFVLKEIAKDFWAPGFDMYYMVYAD